MNTLVNLILDGLERQGAFYFYINNFILAYPDSDDAISLEKIKPDIREMLTLINKMEKNLKQ